MSVKKMGAKTAIKRVVPDVMNVAGGAAYSQSLYSEYLKMLLMNVAGDTYYVDADQNRDWALQLHEAMYTESVEFMAKAAIYARKAGMRLQPIVALAVLAAKMGKDRPQTNAWVKRVFNEIIWTPGDLQDLMALLTTPDKLYSRRKSSGKLSLGNKKTGFARHIAAWLNNLSEYHAIKYGSENSPIFPLRDILRLVRPVPQTETQKYLFMYLVNKDAFKAAVKEVDMSSLLPQIMAFENLKSASSEEEALHWIETGRLPHEVVTGVTKMTPILWAKQAYQMPYFALIRNLVTLNRNGVLTGETLDYVKHRLVNTEHLQKAKILPFQVLTALRIAHNTHSRTYLNENPGVQPIPQSVLNALQEAFELSLLNLEELQGKTAIGVDISGSMSSPVTGNNELRFQDVAGIFAGSILKKNPDSLVIPFNHTLHLKKFNSRDSLMSLSEQIGLAQGSTNLDVPLKHLIQNRIGVDNFILLTDMQGYIGQDWYDTWKEYKRIAPKAKAVLIMLAPYRHSASPEKGLDVFHIFGWDNNVLKLTTQVLNGGEAQLQEVWNI